MKLTDIKCKSAQPKEKPYKLFDGGGLYLDVKPNGSKYWRLKYRYQKKEKLLSFGVYPRVSLKEAREKREEAQKLLDSGKDPSVEKKREKALAQQNAVNTFEAIAREWYVNRADSWKPRYAKEVITRLENDIFPHLGSLPIKDIEPPLLLEVIRKVEKRGAPDLAKRHLQKCGEIFRYGIATGKAVRDISADIKDALRPTKKTHFAALDIQELPDFLKAIDKNDARLYRSTRNALKLIMLTFVRTSELIEGRWDEVDWERQQWVIPKERMKMGKEHIVPLSRQAILILKDQYEISGERPLIFPSNVKPQKSISNNTILGAIKCLGYQGRMTGHGFRALAMSGIKQELGYRHEVVDRQLAHVHKNKIDKAYDRALFLEERKIMMQQWADYIDSLYPNSNVVMPKFGNLDENKRAKSS